MITLEAKVKDKLTGFVGIAVARCEYYTGCVLYEVVPVTLKDGVIQKEFWLDEQRLEEVGKRKAKAVKRKKPTGKYSAGVPTGGPRSGPPARSGPSREFSSRYQ